MSAKFSQIITGAQEIVGEVAGPGVQMYSEDRMFADAKRAFNMMFTKYQWDQYCEWYDLALDGSAGMVTTNALEYVRNFHDFLAVHQDNSDNPLPMLPSRFNPHTLVSGTQPLFWTSLPATHAQFLLKRLKFYPITATGNVNIRAKVYPIKNSEVFQLETYIHIDRDLMEYATAFMTLAFDDMNSNATATCKALMEQRFKDIMAALSSQPLGNYPGGAPTNDWMQV
jgi:hypothetical protein